MAVRYQMRRQSCDEGRASATSLGEKRDIGLVDGDSFPILALTAGASAGRLNGDPGSNCLKSPPELDLGEPIMCLSWKG